MLGVYDADPGAKGPSLPVTRDASLARQQGETVEALKTIIPTRTATEGGTQTYAA